MSLRQRFFFAATGSCFQSLSILQHALLVNSTPPDYCYGGLDTDINNLLDTNGTCGTPVITNDPNLGPLADNGGYGQTFALLLGSPAIDAGDDAFCPTTDQRGVSRPQGARCDIGAFEIEIDSVPLVSSIQRSDPSPTNAASIKYAVTFSEDVRRIPRNNYWF